MTVCELLSDKSKWTQGYLALNSFNRKVEAESKAACKWCLAGAVEKVCGYDIYRKLTVIKKLKKSIKNIFNYECSISVFNDNVTFTDVRKVIEDAGV